MQIKIKFLKSFLLLIVCNVVISCHGFCSAVSHVDSLSAVLKTLKDDTSKVNTLNLMGMELLDAGDYEKARKAAEESMSLSGKLNFQKGIAKSFQLLSLIEEDHGQFAEALRNC